MSQNEVGKSHTGVVSVLFLGVAIAIGGNIYESMCRDRLERDLARVQVTTQQQVAKLSDTTKGAVLENQQRFDALESQVAGATDLNLRQVRSELKKTNSQLVDGVEQKRQQLVSQLADLRVDTSEKLGRVSDDLANTGADVKRVEGDLENTTSDVKRVAGDLNTVTGTVATNSKELAALKELGERNYFEFNLSKTKGPQKIGDIRMVLKKTDPKHNRYTVEVLADDKKVEKKDKTTNEPVQLYLSGSSQVYEIVVNQVQKNEVVGYVATPKVKLPRGQSS
jgi:hypothetical protein